MKKGLLKTLVLSTVFAAAAVPAFAQSPYSDLQSRVNNLGDMSHQIEMTVHTQQVLSLPKDTPEINALKANLKKSVDETAPQIILTSGLSAQQRQALIDTMEQKHITLPDYLSKVDGKTTFIEPCELRLGTPDGATSVAAAREVAGCVAEMKGSEAAPVATQVTPPPAPVVQQHVPAPVQQAPASVPVKAAPPVAPPAAPPAAPQNSGGGLSAIFAAVSMKEIGMGLGGLVLAIGAFFGIRKMTQKKDPALTPMPDSAPPPPPKNDTAPSAKPKNFSI